MSWNRSEFQFRGPDDFVRLDEVCARFLLAFYRWLQTREGGCLSPLEATPLAHAADRFLRNFLVDILEKGPVDAAGRHARQYAGNWYIIHTLTPTHKEVDEVLPALSLLYRYLAREGIVSGHVADETQYALSDVDFYHRRLDEFWDLTPDAISAWRAVDDYRAERAQPYAKDL